MAGISAERQETGFVNAVRNALKITKKKPIDIIAGDVILENVVDADKYTGRQSSGAEPYTDIVVRPKNSKSINLSLKGESAPSLAGGGMKGLEEIVPGIAGKFMKAALKELLNQGYKKGDKIPDVYGRITSRLKEKIVVGNQAMGGPIDYMYIGPMDVKATFDEKRNALILNGNLIESKQFAKTHDLYFRLRARREDQTFDPKAEKAGIPKIYGVSPSKGDSAGRIVITDSIPKEAIIVDV